MKLAELLARELKVWADTTDCYVQDNSGDVWPYIQAPRYAVGCWLSGEGAHIDQESDAEHLPFAELATDHATAIVTRADWEAEVARLAKPEQSPRERIKELHAFAMAVGMGVSVENPSQWRDRIREIDITVEALEEERAGLVQQLEDEGFQLIVL